MGITKPSNQLHMPPPSSIHLHPALCNTLNNIWTKILHVIGQFPQIYAEKLKIVHFDLKIGTHGILEVLIPNLDLDFWNFEHKIHCWANLGPKIQNCPFCLKIGALSISRILIPNLDLDFWNFNPKIHFWANLGTKI